MYPLPFPLVFLTRLLNHTRISPHKNPVQTTGVTDETVGGIDFEVKMVAGNVGVILIFPFSPATT
jgi:hypothetical protein